MKKSLLIILIVLVAILVTTTVVLADKPVSSDSLGVENQWVESKKADGSSCTKIQSGELLRSDDVPITTGFDEWGYNYQAHMFNGTYCDAYRDAAWCQPYKDVELLMKWNDAWLANVDCDGDSLLDRHYGYSSYIGSGAWETNHQSGEYLDPEGNVCKWTYFVKIIAVPNDATLSDGFWYATDGAEIGAEIWGSFAIIQQVYNDPCSGDHGIEYLSQDHAGFGGW